MSVNNDLENWNKVFDSFDKKASKVARNKIICFFASIIAISVIFAFTAGPLINDKPIWSLLFIPQSTQTSVYCSF